MNWPWAKPLTPNMIPNPVLYMQNVPMGDDVCWPSDESLAEIFPTPSHSLKTWNRTEGVKELDPHWIGVRKQTPLHYDPAYPRYTHHLLVRVDGFVLRGINQVETPRLGRGAYLVLDTHSPHQLFAKNKTDMWYVAASSDDHVIHPPEEMIPWLVGYATENTISAGIERVNGRLIENLQ